MLAGSGALLEGRLLVAWEKLGEEGQDCGLLGPCRAGEGAPPGSESFAVLGETSDRVPRQEAEKVRHIHR